MKTYVMLGEEDFWDMWEVSYQAVNTHLRAPNGFWVGEIVTNCSKERALIHPLQHRGVHMLVGYFRTASLR